MDTDPLTTLLTRGPVLPVVTIEDADRAVPLVDALAAGGITTVEVTLRTAAALAAIRAIHDARPDVRVGAGTVLDPDQLHACAEAGAAFAVSPGATPRLLDAAAQAPIPLLPGAATASEVMALLERGHRTMKVFPAEPVGGIAWLRALEGPLPEARFCPTGGVGAASAPDYLGLDNVVCVGGSWLAPADAMAHRDWARITDLAHAAAALAPRSHG
jgi:2-dehydro-3-deoxyphosphogluconate aldolase/(4S)-4-hydroxy-2-oxoglutarate aldolase